MRLDETRDTSLQVEGLRAGDEIVQLTRRVLKRELDMIEACRFQRSDPLLIEADPEVIRFV